MLVRDARDECGIHFSYMGKRASGKAYDVVVAKVVSEMKWPIVMAVGSSAVL